MMKKMFRGTSAFLLAGALSLGGCSESKTGPSDGVTEGYVRADFSGSYSGRLDATDKDMGKDLELRNEVVAAALITEGGFDLLFVTGIEFIGANPYDNRGHMVSFFIFNPKIGTYSGDALCSSEDPESWLGGCSAMALFGAIDGETEWEAVLAGGSLRITALTDDRISGTFDLNGESFTRPQELDRSPEEDEDGWEPAGRVNAKNGKYDLEITEYEDFDDFFFRRTDERVTGDGLRLDARRGRLEGRLQMHGR
jgi:hypothetical protein